MFVINVFLKFFSPKPEIKKIKIDYVCTRNKFERMFATILFKKTLFIKSQKMSSELLNKRRFARWYKSFDFQNINRGILFFFGFNSQHGTIKAIDLLHKHDDPDFADVMFQNSPRLL